MFENPYDPYGYNMQNNRYSGTAPYQQNFMNRTQPTVMQVPTIQQVEQVQIQAGGRALIMVQNAPVIAMRTADNLGLVQTDYYKIEKIDTEKNATSDYVTRAEFENFKQSFQNTVNSSTENIEFNKADKE